MTSTPRLLIVIAALAVMAAVVGCAASRPKVIDGFTLGGDETCSPGISSPDPVRSCAGHFALATAALDAREPNHAAITSIQEYTDGTQPGPIDVTGDGPIPSLASRHPGPLVNVFVFTLADGSVRATGVACEEDPATPCVGIGTYPS